MKQTKFTISKRKFLFFKGNFDHDRTNLESYFSNNLHEQRKQILNFPTIGQYL